MNTPPLTELHAFYCVAQHGSFRRAAKERGVTPSAISHSVSTLETRLALRLLHRTTRSLSLTDAGERLMSHLRPMFSRLDSALEEMDALRSSPIGTLRLNLPAIAVPLYISPALERLRQRYPNVKLEIRTDNALVDIVQAGFDAGIRYADTLPQDMVAQPLKPSPKLIVVGAPAYLARHGVPDTPHDLQRHACITQRFPNGEHYAWEFQQDGKEFSVSVMGPMAVDNHPLMIEAALSGMGLICTYEVLIARHLAKGELVEILTDWRQSETPLHIYYPSRRHVAPPLRALLDTWRSLGML